MTDITDFTGDRSDPRPDRPRRMPAAPMREFYAYFAVIFIATLPLCLVTWILSAARRLRLPEKDPISKAWSQARIITPMIFHG